VKQKDFRYARRGFAADTREAFNSVINGTGGNHFAPKAMLYVFGEGWYINNTEEVLQAGDIMIPENFNPLPEDPSLSAWLDGFMGSIRDV
jgi:hypothetical protein